MSYVPSQHCEVSRWYALAARSERIVRALKKLRPQGDDATISTGNCSDIRIEENSIDYVFTEPPFGENIYYADLNFLVESWHRVLTDAGPEAIVERAKKKGTVEYQDLMRCCFEQYHRVLKPGRWMTVVFSNSRNTLWRAIQEAMGTAGFVVADVRTLDKKQGSYRLVTSSAVKQDLVISAYEPTEALARGFDPGSAPVEGVWSFVEEHLRNVPGFVGAAGGEAEVIAERTEQRLHDHGAQARAVPQRGGPRRLPALLRRAGLRDHRGRRRQAARCGHPGRRDPAHVLRRCDDAAGD